MKIPRGRARFYAYWAIPIALYGLFVLLVPRREARIFPSEQTKVWARSDRDAGGNSTSDVRVKEGKAYFSFTLGDSVQIPTASVSFQHDPARIDWADYNEVVVEIQSVPGKLHEVYLMVPDQITRDGRPIKEALLRHELLITEGQTRYKLPFDEFYLPAWWFRRVDVQNPLDISADIGKTESLRIQTGAMYRAGDSGSYVVQGVSLRYNPWPLIGKVGIGVAIFQFVWLLGYLLSRKYRIQIVAIPYEPKQLSSQSEKEYERLMGVISSHYHEDLTTDFLEQQTGISRFRVPTILKAKTGHTLKQLIATLRVEEAKRLLKTTDLRVVEISSELGFEHQSHFNRVFKKEVGITPLEYRKTSTS